MKDIRISNNRGITLIALIITIIVMLILAGVSIALAVSNNGVVSKAQTVRLEQEKGDLEDTIEISKIYGTSGKVDLNQTASAIWNNLKAKGYKLKALDGTEITSLGAFQNLVSSGELNFIAEGKYDLYEISIKEDGKVTILSKASGKADSEDEGVDEELEIEYALQNQYARPIIIPYVKKGLTKTQKENILLGLFSRFGITASTIEEGIIAAPSTMWPTEELTATTVNEALQIINEKIFHLNENLTLDKFLSIMSIYAMNIELNGSPYDIFSNELVYLEQNMTNTIEFTYNEKTAEIEVECSSNLGKLVKYNNMDWYVLYDDDEFGLQLMLKEPCYTLNSSNEEALLTLGPSDETIDMDEIVDLNGDEDLDFEKGIYSYNNFVNTLNNACKKVINTSSIPNYLKPTEIRSFGSDPKDPYNDECGYLSESEIEGYNQAEETWFHCFSGKIKQQLNASNEDVDRMDYIYEYLEDEDIYANKEYWWGVRYSNGTSERDPELESSERFWSNTVKGNENKGSNYNLLRIFQRQNGEIELIANDQAAYIRPVVMLDSTKCKLSDTTTDGYYKIVEK